MTKAKIILAGSSLVWGEPRARNRRGHCGKGTGWGGWTFLPGFSQRCPQTLRATGRPAPAPPQPTPATFLGEAGWGRAPERREAEGQRCLQVWRGCRGRTGRPGGGLTSQRSSRMVTASRCPAKAFLPARLSPTDPGEFSRGGNAQRAAGSWSRREPLRGKF